MWRGAVAVGNVADTLAEEVPSQSVWALADGEVRWGADGTRLIPRKDPVTLKVETKRLIEHDEERRVLRDRALEGQIDSVVGTEVGG
jgi:hypothetical protein